MREIIGIEDLKKKSQPWGEEMLLNGWPGNPEEIKHMGVMTVRKGMLLVILFSVSFLLFNSLSLVPQ